MLNDKRKHGPSDRSRIDSSETYECRYWAETFGVSPDRLKDAINKVGPLVEDVAEELGKGAWMRWSKEHG